MTKPNEILSQREVDALLNGGADEPAQAAAPQEDMDGVRPCDLTNPPRTIRGRMPTLDIINDRFARRLRAEFLNFLRRSPEIDPQKPRVEKYGEFLGNLVTPTNLNIVNIKSLSCTGLVVMEPQLVFTAVDHLFGGDGRYHMRVEGRDFTPVEQRIIERMLNIVTTEYERAWAPVHPLQFEFVRSEMHTQFANILAPTDLVVTSTFDIEFGNVKGALHICVPYSALEPLRDALTTTRPSGDAGPGERWLRMLTAQVQQAEVQLTAPLTHMRTPLADLMKLKAGDVISMDVPQKIRAEIEGVPILECRFGVSNGRYALKVERVMTFENEPTVSA
jgi:flagellar motor switch protein FliM